MFRDFKEKITSAVKSYPVGDRAFRALVVFVTLLVVTRRDLHFAPSNWRLEPWELIVICTFSAAQLFEPRGKWFMFFIGIGIGEVLPHLSR